MAILHNQQTLANLIQNFYQQLKSTRVLVGFSGGLDSTVLLHLLQQFKPSNIQLSALHVHHGLQAIADDWVLHCQNICQQIGVDLQIEYVTTPAGASLEQQARQARYAAFARHLQAGDTLCVGHHQQDQAETFLLNLLRGAGVKGLAAMPAIRRFNQAWLVRPLLSAPYQMLVDYAQQQNLSWVEDPSNHQNLFKRNFIRNQLFPVLNQAWSQPAVKIAQAAEHLAEASDLLTEVAAQDLAQIEHQVDRINLQQLSTLSVPRQKNLLNFWAQQCLGLNFSSWALTWILTEAINARIDAKPELSFANGHLRVFRQQLFFVTEQPAEFNLQLDLTNLTAAQQQLAAHNLTIELKPAGNQAGIRQDLIAGNKLIIRNLKPSDQINRKSLKNWFQQQAIPPWQRKNWPVVELNSELVQIVGFKVFAEFAATNQQSGVFIGFH